MFEKHSDGVRIVTGLRGSQKRRGSDREDGVIASTIEDNISIRWSQLQLDIRIGSTIEQHLDHFKCGGLIGGGKVWSTTPGQCAEIDGGIERRSSVEIPLVHVRAGGDQIR